MAETSAAHWEEVYRGRDPAKLSWYQPHPDVSLELIAQAMPAGTGAIIEVGGGASILVDHLLGAGYRDVTVLDIAPAALTATQARLGPAAAGVAWIAADLLGWQPARRYDLWHDRALFHFLTSAADRGRYVDVMRRALADSGHVVLSTFAADGPTRCSGLDVCRYGPAELATALGDGFHLLHAAIDDHRTPAGITQRFQFTLWRYRQASGGP